MTRCEVTISLRKALAAWRGRRGPSNRAIWWSIEDRPPGPADWNIGIDRDAKGACVRPEGRPPWWRRFLGLFVATWRVQPIALIILFAPSLLDDDDVRRVAWHELAHAHGLDEEEAEEAGLPAWTTDA